MKWSTVRFVFKQTLQGFLLDPWSHAITALTVAMSVLIFGAFLIILYNTGLLLERWRSTHEVTVYLRKGLPEQGQKDIFNRIKILNGVNEAQWMTEEEALVQFEAELGPQASLLDGLDTNPLPASVEFVLEETLVQNPGALRDLLAHIQAIEGVEEIHSGQDWITRLASLKRGVAILSLMLGGGLLVAIVFIISNTIKLTVYAREEEIEIMSLVGATDAFIRAPYVVDGIIQGGAGSVLAILILLVGFEIVAPIWNTNLKALFLGMRLSFLPWRWVMGIMVGGLIVGGLGSFLSLARFLRT